MGSNPGTPVRWIDVTPGASLHRVPIRAGNPERGAIRLPEYLE